MFILERLISLGFFFLAILIACFLMTRVKGKQYKFILFSYLLVLSIFAWAYEPYITADLYRLRQYIEFWIHQSFENVFDYAFHTLTPSWILFSYFTNQLENENWMQTIACFWCYGNIFYVVSKCIERFNLKKGDRGLILFYIMAIGSLYLQAISGIRTMLGFSIVFLCIYREYFEGKSVIFNLPFYVIAGMFHSAVLVLIGMRFVALLFTGKTGIGRIINILIAIGIIMVGIYYGYEFILQASNKATGYMTDDNEYIYMWEYLIGGIEIVQVLFLCYWCRKGNITIATLSNFNMYIYITAAFTIGCICFMPLSYAIFRRFSIFATMLSLPVLGMFLQDYSMLKRVDFHNAKSVIKFLSVLIILLSFVRGDICGYKFF